MVVEGQAYTIMPIQNVELSTIGDKLVEMLERYELTNISITVIRGVDDEKPYRHIRTVDKDGRNDSLTMYWESDD